MIKGEGQPTRKYDGTCVMFDGAEWSARREVKTGKADAQFLEDAPRDFDGLATRQSED